MNEQQHDAGTEGAQALPATKPEAATVPAPAPGEGESPRSPSPNHTAELEAARARIAELEAAVGESKTLREQHAELSSKVGTMEAALVAARRHALVGRLEASGVPEDMREDVAVLLGDVDLTTSSGVEKVQKFLEARPSLTTRATAGEQVQLATVTDLDKWERSPFVNADDLRAKMASIGRGTR